MEVERIVELQILFNHTTKPQRGDIMVAPGVNPGCGEQREQTARRYLQNGSVLLRRWGSGYP